MNRTRTFRLSWSLPVTMLASIALSAGPFPARGQTIVASPEAHSSAPTILLSGPTGDRFTLVHSANTGWQLQAGWATQQDDNSARSTRAVLPAARALPADEQPALERPLTVFVDGPTGYTFIYVFDEGWKFVGRIADRSR
ncbi:MAG TPA: hypothetical protein VK864_03575 [Longimicrobiales bacterium]|nr:hypothetical protein [Longimicrobiales bacterium]